MKIGIVAHFAYGAMRGGSGGHVGGVERQTSMLARWLASRGHEVSLLTWDEGQGNAAQIDGVQMIGMCRREGGISGFRFFHPRWTSLNWALQKADADLYYHNCAEYVTGQVALWCRSRKRHFVYSVASDPDCDPHLPKMRTIREKVLYRYGLRAADSVIVQTMTQQRMLKEGFDRDSVVLPMPCPGPDDHDFRLPRPPENGRCRVLWAGRIRRMKRLDLLLEVAEALPHIAFDVAGDRDAEDEYNREILVRVRLLPNVTLHGKVARDRMPGLYERASFFCNTSIMEGFPNTFLEAWSYGIPVIATVDPDGLIERHRLGLRVSNASEVVAGIRKFFEDRIRWMEASVNARQYFLKNHQVENVMPRFEELFLDVIRGNGLT